MFASHDSEVRRIGCLEQLEEYFLFLLGEVQVGRSCEPEYGISFYTVSFVQQLLE